MASIWKDNGSSPQFFIDFGLLSVCFKRKLGKGNKWFMLTPNTAFVRHAPQYHQCLEKHLGELQSHFRLHKHIKWSHAHQVPPLQRPQRRWNPSPCIARIQLPCKGLPEEGKSPLDATDSRGSHREPDCRQWSTIRCHFQDINSRCSFLNNPTNET